MTKTVFSCALTRCVVFLIILLPLCVQAQKKSRRGGELHASSGTRMREAEFYFTEGEKFFILEDYSKALSYYEKTLELAPNNATVHYKIAEVLSQSSQPSDLQKASVSIETALRHERKNKYFYLLAASIHTSLTRFDKAAAVYEQMIQEVPGTEEYLYELAAVYQYGNRMDDAIKTYQRAESVLGVNEISSLQKQRLFFDQGKTKEAIAEGDKLVRAFPHEERYVMAISEALSQRGLKGDAINYLERFIAENPDAAHCKMLLAGIYRENQQESKARPLLNELFDQKDIEVGSKLLILGAYNAELNQNKTRRVRDADKEQFAEQLFSKLQKTHGDEPNVHIVGGDLYLSLGKNREAQREYMEAIKSGDVNFEVWENLLFLDNQLELYDQLITHSEQALELFPNHGMLYYFNGYAHLRKRDFKIAISSFEQAKKLSAANTTLLTELNAVLGEAYYGAKDYEKSEKAFEDALAANPENTTVLNNYSFYLAVRKTNLEKAERMSTLLVKNHPDNPTYLDTHAWVLYARGKFKDARKVIEKAIASGKATATHLEHYGDILYKLGEVDAAVAQWEKARGMNANSESLNKKIANRKIYE